MYISDLDRINAKLSIEGKQNQRDIIKLMAWLPNKSEIAKKSEDLVLEYNPFWTGGHMKRYELKTPEWSKELFEVENAITYDLTVTFSREAWHGRMKACRGIGASSLSVEEIAEWEKEHLDYLSTVPETFDILRFATILNLKKRPL